MSLLIKWDTLAKEKVKRPICVLLFKQSYEMVTVKAQLFKFSFELGKKFI